VGEAGENHRGSIFWKLPIKSWKNCFSENPWNVAVLDFGHKAGELTLVNTIKTREVNYPAPWRELRHISVKTTLHSYILIDGKRRKVHPWNLQRLVKRKFAFILIQVHATKTKFSVHSALMQYWCCDFHRSSKSWKTHRSIFLWFLHLIFLTIKSGLCHKHFQPRHYQTATLFCKLSFMRLA